MSEHGCATVGTYQEVMDVLKMLRAQPCNHEKQTDWEPEYEEFAKRGWFDNEGRLGILSFYEGDDACVRIHHPEAIVTEAERRGATIYLKPSHVAIATPAALRKAASKAYGAKNAPPLKYIKARAKGDAIVGLAIYHIPTGDVVFHCFNPKERTEDAVRGAWHDVAPYNDDKTYSEKGAAQ